MFTWVSTTSLSGIASVQSILRLSLFFFFKLIYFFFFTWGLLQLLGFILLTQ